MLRTALRTVATPSTRSSSSIFSRRSFLASAPLSRRSSPSPQLPTMVDTSASPACKRPRSTPQATPNEAQPAPLQGPGASSAKKGLAADLLTFCNYAWTPYHAVEEASRRLLAAGAGTWLHGSNPCSDCMGQGASCMGLGSVGTSMPCLCVGVPYPGSCPLLVPLVPPLGFQHISEREQWGVKPGGKYFFTRNFSTVVAFAIGEKFEAGNGFYMIGAHTDR